MKLLSRQRITTRLFASASLLLGAAAAQGATNILFDDFPDHQGENGIHAEAYDHGSASYRLLAESASPHAFVSRDANLWWVPCVAGDDADHNRPAEYAVLSWRAATDALVALIGSFLKTFYADGGVCNGVQASIQLNARRPSGPPTWASLLAGLGLIGMIRHARFRQFSFV
jgi:hypothetical protein